MAMTPERAQLAGRVFGVSDGVTDLATAARQSTVTFVRSQDELSVWSRAATGRKLSAMEALSVFGFEALVEAVEYGSAILPCDRSEPAATLKARRGALGLSAAEVARSAGVAESDILRAEDSSKISPIRYLERIARQLGLDERHLSITQGAGGDSDLAIRLRDMRSSSRGTSPSVVTALAEAAWVISTQRRLEDELAQVLGTRPDRTHWGQAPSDDYKYPTYKRGYDLALRTREILHIGPEMPIDSVRKLCERLRIPVVQIAMPDSFAGATVATEQARGVVVNTQGANQRVFVRRATIAHELGHLLWDPRRRLNTLRVDNYTDIDRVPWEIQDKVEARANAFSVEFLAPQAAVVARFRALPQGSGLAGIMNEFGISFTAARNHLRNALGGAFDESREVVSWETTPNWDGPESFTTDYFPTKATPLSRRGTFAGMVVAAEKHSLISLDTAGEYLNISSEEYLANRQAIESIFA